MQEEPAPLPGVQPPRRHRLRGGGAGGGGGGVRAARVPLWHRLLQVRDCALPQGHDGEKKHLARAPETSQHLSCSPPPPPSLSLISFTSSTPSPLYSPPPPPHAPCYSPPPTSYLQPFKSSASIKPILLLLGCPLPVNLPPAEIVSSLLFFLLLLVNFLLSRGVKISCAATCRTFSPSRSSPFTFFCL